MGNTLPKGFVLDDPQSLDEIQDDVGPVSSGKLPKGFTLDLSTSLPKGFIVDETPDVVPSENSEAYRNSVLSLPFEERGRMHDTFMQSLARKPEEKSLVSRVASSMANDVGNVAGAVESGISRTAKAIGGSFVDTAGKVMSGTSYMHTMPSTFYTPEPYQPGQVQREQADTVARQLAGAQISQYGQQIVQDQNLGSVGNLLTGLPSQVAGAAAAGPGFFAAQGVGTGVQQGIERANEIGLPVDHPDMQREIALRGMLKGGVDAASAELFGGPKSLQTSTSALKRVAGSSAGGFIGGSTMEAANQIVQSVVDGKPVDWASIPIEGLKMAIVSAGQHGLTEVASKLIDIHAERTRQTPKEPPAQPAPVQPEPQPQAPQPTPADVFQNIKRGARKEPYPEQPAPVDITGRILKGAAEQASQAETPKAVEPPPPAKPAIPQLGEPKPVKPQYNPNDLAAMFREMADRVEGKKAQQSAPVEPTAPQPRSIAQKLESGTTRSEQYRTQFARQREQIQKRIAEGKTVTRSMLKNFIGEPWADERLAQMQPKKEVAPDAMSKRRTQLENDLRDAIAREIGPDIMNGKPFPLQVQVQRGEKSPGSLVPLNEAKEYVDQLPEDHPARLLLHNLAELEKNTRGTKVQKVNTNDVQDGTRVQVNDKETFTIDKENMMVEDGITVPIPPEGIDVYGKKVLPPKEGPKEIGEFAPPTEKTAMQKDMFGGSFIEGSGIGEQRPMFHEPNEAKPVASERVGSKNANDPKNTGEMFPPSNSAGANTPSEAEAARKAWVEKGTDSPWFKRWFSGSKVTDKAGKPLVVHHGTADSADITEFRNPYSPVEGWNYFTDSQKFIDATLAIKYTGGTKGDRVYPVYLNIKNPLDLTSLPPRKTPISKFESALDSAGVDRSKFSPLSSGDLFQYLNNRGNREAMRDAIIAAGYDGVKFRDVNDDAVGNSFIAFRPEQIKSATGNRGTFEVDNPNMLYSGVPFPDAIDKAVGRAINEDLKPKAIEAAKAVRDLKTSIQRTFAPQTQSPEARMVADAIREGAANTNLDTIRAEQSTMKARKFFDDRNVKDNYDFINRMQRGEKQSTPHLDDIAKQFRSILDGVRDEVRALGEGKLEQFDENYFPQAWKRPEQTSDILQQIVGKRPLEGKKGFLKPRTFDKFQDGLDAGYEPISNNPVDLVMHKLVEMKKYVESHKYMQEMKDNGIAKFVMVGDKPPEGYVVTNIPAFKKYGPPVKTVNEYVDQMAYDGLMRLADKLGIEHERKNSLGGGILGKSYTGADKVETRFATNHQTLAHEIGHQLDEKFGLGNSLFNNPDAKVRAKTKVELRALADQRNATLENPKGESTPYNRKRVEQIANLIDSYVHMPDKLQEIAPTAMSVLNKIIDANPELADLKSITRSTSRKTLSTEIPIGGFPHIGDYAMPREVADVFNNYLSPGLRGNSAFRAYSALGNLMLQARLGVSLFHAGFTTVDAMTSRLALGIEKIASGDVSGGLATAASSPISPVTNLIQGSKLRSEMLNPGSFPEYADLSNAVRLAGGRIGIDSVYQTKMYDKMADAFRKGNVVGGIVRIPTGAMDLMARPLMQYLVPRQKLGIFADMARMEIDKLGPKASKPEIRRAMAKAWDSVDNRMGQLAYDNLFWNKTAKDLSMASVQSLGWNLGTIRELGGGAADWVKFAKDLATGGNKEFTHRMAYTIALPVMAGTLGAVMHYLMTGQSPNELKDYFYPKTGQKDADGNDLRLQLPTYMKDVFGASNHPGRMIVGKMHPMIGTIAEMLKNRDFYNTKIRNEDDPLMQQVLDELKFMGKSFMPYTVSNIQKMNEDDAPLAEKVLPMIGITPAPKEASQTKAQQLAYELSREKIPQGARTTQEAERSKLKSDLVKKIREGDTSDVRQALKDGKITYNDVKSLVRRSKEPSLLHYVKGMDVDDAIKVYSVANDNEKKMLKRIIYEKIKNSNMTTAAKRDRLERAGILPKRGTDAGK